MGVSVTESAGVADTLDADAGIGADNSSWAWSWALPARNAAMLKRSAIRISASGRQAAAMVDPRTYSAYSGSHGRKPTQEHCCLLDEIKPPPQNRQKARVTVTRCCVTASVRPSCLENWLAARRGRVGTEGPPPQWSRRAGVPLTPVVSGAPWLGWRQAATAQKEPGAKGFSDPKRPRPLSSTILPSKCARTGAGAKRERSQALERRRLNRSVLPLPRAQHHEV